MNYIHLVVLALLFTVQLQAGESKWWVSTFKNVEKGNTLDRPLSGADSVRLKSGWACDVTATSVNGARQIACKKGTEQVEFSVQCDEQRSTDRSQVRFRSGKAIDFIEVSCKQES